MWFTARVFLLVIICFLRSIWVLFWLIITFNMKLPFLSHENWNLFDDLLVKVEDWDNVLAVIVADARLLKTWKQIPLLQTFLGELLAVVVEQLGWAILFLNGFDIHIKRAEDIDFDRLGFLWVFSCLLSSVLLLQENVGGILVYIILKCFVVVMPRSVSFLCILLFVRLIEASLCVWDFVVFRLTTHDLLTNSGS